MMMLGESGLGSHHRRRRRRKRARTRRSSSSMIPTRTLLQILLRRQVDAMQGLPSSRRSTCSSLEEEEIARQPLPLRMSTCHR